MGERTFTEMQTDLKLELGNRDDTIVTSARLGDWINQAYIQLTCAKRIFEIKKRLYFPELEVFDWSKSTANTTKTISIPTGCIVIRHIKMSSGGDNKPLVRMTEKKYWDYIPNTSGYGEPTHWVRYNNQIYLYPTPDATYKMRIAYKKRPTLLSSGDDLTAIGDEWDDPIVQLAVIRSHLRIGEIDKANAKRSYFNEAVSNIVELYFEEELALDGRITPTFELTNKENY